MHVRFIRLLPVLIAGMGIPCSAQRVTIIPEPVMVTARPGDFHFNNATRIVLHKADTGCYQAAIRFAEAFRAVSGIMLPLEDMATADTTANCLIVDRPSAVDNAEGHTSAIFPGKLLPAVGGQFRAANREGYASSGGMPSHVANPEGYASSGNMPSRAANPEAYTLDISPARIRLTAAGNPGLFYALISLQQLLPAARPASGRWTAPACYILDYPAFPYRGMHLDVSRHFFPMPFIKHYLDLLAMYKINTFHWHLTDSHGWRLEIKQYPRLTSVGAWRAARPGIPMTLAQPTQPGERADYGGYYTQEQVREIVAYARERFITVIPEIEMPGHCTAALVAYPQYTCLNNPVPLLMPCGYAGDLQHNFCPGNDSVYTFLQNVLQEVMELFPSPYIHIGGDEVKPASWLRCPRCRQRMKTEGLEGAHGLQAYFTRRIDSFVTARGRKLIGWDEIVEAGISPNAAVMSWRGNEGGIKAARAGHDVVMAPYRYTYFDFYQSDPRLEPDITYAGLTLDSVYAFTPVPPDLTAGEARHILGGQACLWTENVPTPERVEYMLLPRLPALSEALWTPASQKNYARFTRRVEAHFRRLRQEGVSYARSMYNVSIQPEWDSAAKGVRVALHNQAADRYPLRYTLDGSMPGTQSPLYTSPVIVTRSALLRTALQGVPGKVNEDRFTLHAAAGAPVTVHPATPGAARLTDGIYGTVEPYDGRWVVCNDSIVTITIDLGRQRAIGSIRFNCLEDAVGNIFLPRRIAVSASADGSSYQELYRIYNKRVPQEEGRHQVMFSRKGLHAAARYLQVRLENVPGLLLIDEIIVE